MTEMVKLILPCFDRITALGICNNLRAALQEFNSDKTEIFLSRLIMMVTGKLKLLSTARQPAVGIALTRQTDNSLLWLLEQQKTNRQLVISTETAKPILRFFALRPLIGLD